MTGISPSDLLEFNNGILKWSRYPSLGKGQCPDCDRQAILIDMGSSIRCKPCASVMTRLGPNVEAKYLGSNPLQGHVILHTAEGTTIWASETNIPKAAHDCKYNLVPPTTITTSTGKSEVYQSPYLAESLRYILENDKIRRQPYLFILMQTKKPTILSSLFTNVDENYLVLSGTPNVRSGRRKRTINLNEVKKIVNKGIDDIDPHQYSDESIQMAKLVSGRAKGWVW